MATTNVRWSVVNRLLTNLRSSPEMAGVLIEPGWPGDRVKPETIWVDFLGGPVSIPVMKAGRKERDDNFDIPLEIRVANNTSLDLTMARLTELVAAVEDILADDPSLDDLEGVIDAEITNERMTCAETREGHLGFAEVVVSVHSRLL